MRYRNSFGISHFTLENYTVTHCVPTNCTLCANRPLTKMSTFPSLDRLDCFTHSLTRSVGRSVYLHFRNWESIRLRRPNHTPSSLSSLRLSFVSLLPVSAADRQIRVDRRKDEVELPVGRKGRTRREGERGGGGERERERRGETEGERAAQQ